MKQKQSMVIFVNYKDNMIQQQQQTNQWVLTSVQFNLVFTVFWSRTFLLLVKNLKFNGIRKLNDFLKDIQDCMQINLIDTKSA